MFPGFHGRMRPIDPLRMWMHGRHMRHHWRHHMRHGYGQPGCCCLPFFVLMLLPFALLLAWGAMVIL